MASDKGILITGGARRLGRATALRAAHSGYDIALHYYSSEKEAQQLKEEIEEIGKKCVLFQQNLSDIKALDGLVANVLGALPHVRVLVNNASTFRRIGFEETTPESMEEDLCINFKAPFFLTQSFVKRVKNAAVVNMLDSNFHGNSTNYCAYLLAKKSLASFTQMAGRSLANQARVNGVCPGFILPSENVSVQDPDIARLPPSGTQPTVDEVAEAVLTAIESDYMYGQLLYVDGAERLKA